MKPRHFFKDNDPQQILIDQAKALRARAARMPAGVERDRLLKQACENEVRANLHVWANSPGLQPPER
jgi:hypothetical protein